MTYSAITVDNGVKFLDTEGIKRSDKRESVHCFSCPERGSNKSLNRILRRSIPKTNINRITAAELQRIEDWAHNYPRKLFRYKTANKITAA